MHFSKYFLRYEQKFTERGYFTLLPQNRVKNCYNIIWSPADNEYYKIKHSV